MIQSKPKHYSRLERIMSAAFGALLISILAFIFYKFDNIVMTIFCSIWAYAYLFYAILLKPYPIEEIKYVGGSQWLARKTSTRQTVTAPRCTRRFENTRCLPIASVRKSTAQYSDLDGDDVFTTNISSISTNHIPEVRINPATGLVMMGAIDSAGNIYGSDGNSSMCHNGLPYLGSDCGVGIDDTNDIGSLTSFDNDTYSSFDDDFY